jgi:hypothetical protein
MWSGVGRIDMLASSDLCKDQGYPNCYYDEHNRICKGGHWWHRGRPGSTLSLADETIRSISKLQDDYSFTLASWLEMTALEDYVAARGFTYRCTSFVDFEQNRIKGDALVVPFHRCLAELNLTLDRKNWLPLRGEDYFGDWCRERKLLVNDGFHPGLDGPYRWPREVVMPILLAQGILYDI